MSRVSLLLVAGVALWAAVSRAAAPDVRYAGDRLTVDVRDVELIEVLDAIGSQAGFEVHGNPTPQRVTLRLDAVALAEALSRLLEGQRVAYTYDRSGTLLRVRFLGASTVVPGRTPPGDEPPVQPEAGEQGSIASDRLVPVEGLLAQALGNDRSTFLQMIGVALQVGDARLRKEALRAALHLLDTGPDLRAEVSRTLEGLDDAALAAWLERSAGENAEEVARHTARFANWNFLRRRAVAVKRLVRTDGR